jgi:hypothetical protein
MKKMKRLILIALILIIIGPTTASCTVKDTKDYMVLSGKILNGELDSFTILDVLENEIAKITINDDGSFSDTLRIKTGYYLFVFENSFDIVSPVYLNKSNDLKAFYNLNDFDENATWFYGKYEGQNVPEIVYFSKKEIIVNKIYGYSNYGKNKPKISSKKELISAYKEFKSEVSKLLDDLNLSSSFCKRELRNIHCGYIYKLYDYEEYLDVLPSEEPLKSEFANLDLNNEWDYFGIPGYKLLVQRKLKVLFCDKTKKWKTEEPLYFIDFIEERIINENIKNDLLYSEVVEEDILSSIKPNIIEDCYKKLMVCITNKEYKEKIKKRYEDHLRTLEGKPACKFINYENYKGGTSSLDDFKGKYVYIDMWATW